MKRPQRKYLNPLAVVVCAMLLNWSFSDSVAQAQATSAPAMLQYYEARWNTIEDRMPDIFDTGYGRLWLPPPSRADSGNHSVGYDVYDRFDLGSPRNETLYGTKTGLKTLVHHAHAAGVLVNTDFIPNHNGFTDAGNVETYGTPTTADDVSFVEAGGYPGFVLTLPNDIDGDFHGAFESGEQNFRLSGLIDIAQDKNHQFIRHPVDPSNPNNIPAEGTVGIFGHPAANVPTPTNTQFYPDQGLGGTVVFDPSMNQNVTLYDFNTSDPFAGDPVMENALGLVMRNARWMIQEVGVDGFRIDAARHFPRWVLDHLDQAMYLADKDPLLDGSQQHVYTFIETGYDSPAFIQDFIRKDINPNNLNNVGGNRDALDFNLFGALLHNLTDNGLANNWHHVRNASIDLNDDQTINGSQGVVFAQSHDEVGPYLQNVAYAYTMLLPGNSLVYLNAKEFGPGRDFPRDGKVDALGGAYGETVTRLVELRNTHGRGDFKERWIDQAFDSNGFSNVYVYERSNSAIVALNSRNDSFVETRNGVQTDFAPGTVLVELTGNAADGAVDPGGVIPEAIRVDGNGQIDVSIPGNAGTGRGYVIYGLAAPQGTMTIGSVNSVLAGANPTTSNFGTARLADIDVVTGDSFTIGLSTQPVTLPAPAGEANAVRDVHADGDLAVFKIDGGIDANANAGVDHTTPGSVTYGFEEFTDTNSPGYVFDGSSNIGTGSGTYEQTIDARDLAEGRHYITVRAFRHRDANTGGDGGPAVFQDFKRTIYVDRLPPESAVASFEPYASDPNNLNNRDLILQSVDQTADNMHVFLDLPAALSDSEILNMVSGDNLASYYDRDQWIRGYADVVAGNHTVTIVTYEETGTLNVQRFTGITTTRNSGPAFGDLSGDGFLRVNDMVGPGGFEEVLWSQNTLFNPSGDVDGNGLVDTRDLLALEPYVSVPGADPRVLLAYDDVLASRGDFDQNDTTDTSDLLLLYSHLGTSDWLYDLDVDGTVTHADAQMLIVDLLRTSPGDFNLDGSVDAADYTLWRNNLGGSLIADGDFDGDVDAADYAVWKQAFGFNRMPLEPASAASIQAANVPEPSTMALLGLLLSLATVWNRCRR